MPQYDKINKVAYVPCEHSDQLGQPSDLSRIFAVLFENSLDPKLPFKRTAKTLISLGEGPG